LVCSNVAEFSQLKRVRAFLHVVSEYISIHAKIDSSKNVFLGYVLHVVSSCVPAIPSLHSLIRGNACAADFYVCESVGKFFCFGFTAAAVANAPGASDNSNAVVQLSSRTQQLFLRFCWMLNPRILLHPETLQQSSYCAVLL
jgi:hypothetical protein